MILLANERHRWPAVRECNARRAGEGGSYCICDQYPGCQGAYILADDGHAIAYYADRAEARRKDAMRARAERVADQPRVPADLAHDMIAEASK